MYLYYYFKIVYKNNLNVCIAPSSKWDVHASKINIYSIALQTKVNLSV